ncbi:hypothetical protein B0H14DRAFT_2594030 [Mycena olivaceomarginata]|nr:hypothetical protein B0H14DRAFT_2594030 [Mycena olivaceomarginata]
MVIPKVVDAPDLLERRALMSPAKSRSPADQEYVDSLTAPQGPVSNAVPVHSSQPSGPVFVKTEAPAPPVIPVFVKLEPEPVDLKHGSGDIKLRTLNEDGHEVFELLSDSDDACDDHDSDEEVIEALRHTSRSSSAIPPSIADDVNDDIEMVEFGGEPPHDGPKISNFTRIRDQIQMYNQGSSTLVDVTGQKLYDAQFRKSKEDVEKRPVGILIPMAMNKTQNKRRSGGRLVKLSLLGISGRSPTTAPDDRHLLKRVRQKRLLDAPEKILREITGARMQQFVVQRFGPPWKDPGTQRRSGP